MFKMTGVNKNHDAIQSKRLTEMQENFEKTASPCNRLGAHKASSGKYNMVSR